MEIIKASRASAELRLGITRYQRELMSFPLRVSAYNVRVLFFSSADADKLKAGLSETLCLFPQAAGRISPDELYIDLNNAGVPFKVVHLTEEPPTEVGEAEWVPRLSNQCNPRNVQQGTAPLLTVTLTTFPSGRAALAIGASHTIFDGMSVYAFFNTWATICRGEKPAAPIIDQSPLGKECLPLSVDPEVNRATFQEAFGEPMAPRWKQVLKDFIARNAIKLMDFVYLNIGPPVRAPIYFSDTELQRIKEAASPDKGQGWVSTQEALCAFMLQQLGKLKADLSGTRPSKPGALRIFRDARPQYQLQPNHILGIGFWIQVIAIDKYLDRSLKDVALEIHDKYRSSSVTEEWRKQTGTMNWMLAPETNLPFMYGAFTLLSDAPYDIVFGLNNQSKVSVGDFGAAANGREDRLLTTAGPNVMLPAKGGTQMYLTPDVLPAKYPGGPEAAVATIKAAIQKL